MTTVFGHLFLAQIAIETMQETVTRIDINILLSEFIWKAGISLSFPSLVFQLGLYIGSGFSNLGGNGRIRRVPQTRFRVESSWIFPTAFPSFPTGYNRKERGKIRWIPAGSGPYASTWVHLLLDHLLILMNRNIFDESSLVYQQLVDDEIIVLQFPQLLANQTSPTSRGFVLNFHLIAL